jgi:DNA-directed RNA polymerase specialized sigma24 family protein
MTSVTKTFKAVKKRQDQTPGTAKKPVRSRIPVKAHHSSTSWDQETEPSPGRLHRVEKLKAEMQRTIQQAIQPLPEELRSGPAPRLFLLLSLSLTHRPDDGGNTCL